MMMMKMDFKKMGFNTEKEYIAFLDAKLASFMKKVDKNIDVFKRLKDR